MTLGKTLRASVLAAMSTLALLACEGGETDGALEEELGDQAPHEHSSSVMRCGYVQPGIPSDDATRAKFAHIGHRRSANITWKVTNRPAYLDPIRVREAVRRALATWAEATSLTFTEASGTVDLEVRFGALDGVGGYQGMFDSARPWEIVMDHDELWSVSDAGPPANWHDIQSVVLHESGHWLGLDHSAVIVNGVAPVMYFANRGLFRTLTNDDLVAISALYDQWQLLSDGIVDVDLAPGQVWALGRSQIGSNLAVQWWAGSGFRQLEGAGVRIAAHPGAGQGPWLVNAAGTIFQRTTNDPNTGHWAVRPGCAKDIAIGGGQIYVIGCDARPGGYGIHRWNGSSWTWIPGGGLRIAVDLEGLPWVVNDANDVWRLHADGIWRHLAGKKAQSIDIGTDGYAFIAGTDGNTYVWNQQTPRFVEEGPAVAQWLKFTTRSSAGTRDVTAFMGGIVWTIQGIGSVTFAPR